MSDIGSGIADCHWCRATFAVLQYQRLGSGALGKYTQCLNYMRIIRRVQYQFCTIGGGTITTKTSVGWNNITFSHVGKSWARQKGLHTSRKG